MQQQITLSKQEKRYYFFYLLGILFLAVVFLGILFLQSFESPFAASNDISIQKLEQKAKFNRRQEVAQPIIDSAFTKLKKLSTDDWDTSDEYKVEEKINDINQVFKDEISITDPRRENYSQIASFYEMYYEDKKIMAKTKDNIKKYERQYDDCVAGIKERNNR